MYTCLLSRKVEFLNLASICPSKTEFSQDCFLCVQIGAKRSFLGCFWPFWGLKTCQNFLAIGRHAYFSKKNPKMLIFLHFEASIKSKCQVAERIGQKNLCFGPKIPKMQKLPQIFLNLGWVFSIRCCVGPRKAQPIFEVYLASFTSSMPSSTRPSGFWFLHCIICFLPSNDGPCASTYCSCCWPSLASFLGAFLFSQANIHDQLEFLAQVWSIWFSSSWQLADFAFMFLRSMDEWNWWGEGLMLDIGF